MKGTLLEYNDNGKILKKTYVEISFASSNEPPIIEVKLPDKQFRNRSIHILAKGLLALIFGRIIERLNS